MHSILHQPRAGGFIQFDATVIKAGHEGGDVHTALKKTRDLLKSAAKDTLRIAWIVPGAVIRQALFSVR